MNLSIYIYMENECQKIIAIWSISIGIFVSFENIFCRLFNLVLKIIFMRIVLEKLFWGTRTIYVVSKNIHIYHLLSTTSCLSCKCFNHWAIWPNNEICFILILNFAKCFSQNQIRQSFSCSLASQPGSTCAVCSEFL